MSEQCGRLTGRVAIVTGAGSGIGRGIARLFAQEGAFVALVDRDRTGLEESAAGIDQRDRLHCIEADVVDAPAADRALAALARADRTPDILVTAAAISVGGILDETAPADWDRVFEVNVKGTYAWCRAALPAMMTARHGSIITIASQLALAGGRGNAAYVASKGAVISLTRSVALDYAPYGIRANCLVPGAIETPMLARSFARQSDPEAARQRSRTRHVLQRFGIVDEVARAAVFLASEDSTFTTGALLPVDGGWLVG